VKFAALTDWYCRISSRAHTGPLFFERTLIVPAYLEILRTSTVPAIRELNGNEDFAFNKMGHSTLPPRYQDQQRLKVYSSVKRVNRKFWVLSTHTHTHTHTHTPDLAFLTFTCGVTCNISHKASNTGRVTGTNRRIVCSHPSNPCLTFFTHTHTSAEFRRS
jgi:hypothetical protein